MFVTAPILLSHLTAFVCALVLSLGSVSDTSRNALPPPGPRFVRPEGALLADDFQRGVLVGWTADREGVWTVRRGMLRAELPDERQLHSILYAGDSTWTNYALDFDVCAIRGVDKGAVVRLRGLRGLGFDLRGPGYQDVRLHLNELPIGKANVVNGNGVWHHVRCEVSGAHCRLLVNGAEVINRRVPLRIPPTGRIALAAYTGGVGQCTVYYDNIVVTALTDAESAQRGQ
jgi:hypothetical protein